MAHFEEGGFDPGAGDALGDIGDEHVHHRVGHLRAERCPSGDPVEEEEGHLVVGVATGGGGGVRVELRYLFGDALNAGDVQAQPDDGGIDDTAGSPGRRGPSRLPTASATRASSLPHSVG